MTVDCSWREQFALYWPSVCRSRVSTIFPQQSAAAERRSRNRFGTQFSFSAAASLCVCVNVCSRKRSCFRSRNENYMQQRRVCCKRRVHFYILNQRRCTSSVGRHSPTLAQVSFVVGRCINVSTQPRAPPTLLLRAEIRDEKNNQTDFFSEFKRDLLLSLRTIWSQKTNDKICY